MLGLRFRKTNYEQMSRKQLREEGLKRKLSPSLFTFKGTEGASSKDRLEIIKQLNILDQQRTSKLAISISVVSLILSLIPILKVLFFFIKNLLEKIAH